ncbi:MAG: ATP-binding cassette domain-containing protein [Ignavibacteria bacterium]|nr:MAG: ATP-binding cassette domain-containing protein [Ignavibacteria bacterium]
MLTIAELDFAFENQTIFQNLNISVEPGEFVYLIGQSGIGKSTLFQLILMNLLPDGGYVSFEDFSSDNIKPKNLPFLRRKIGVVFQDFKLLDDRTVYENLLFVMKVTKNGNRNYKKKILEVLTEVGLSHKSKKYPSELSGGEKQRVAIARAIINEPKLLLADEPTGNLDPATTQEIMEIIKKINKRGTAVIFATHDYDLVKNYPGDKIYKVENFTAKKVILKSKEG